MFEADRPAGRGVVMYATGSEYVGHVAAVTPKGSSTPRAYGVIREGRGDMVYSNGDTYSGTFYRDARHGFGVQLWVNGRSYYGAWVRDKPQGRGVYFYEDGTHFVGTFKDGVRDGFGSMFFATGHRLEGTWKDAALQRGTFSKGRLRDAPTASLAACRTLIERNTTEDDERVVTGTLDAGADKWKGLFRSVLPDDGSGSGAPGSPGGSDGSGGGSPSGVSREGSSKSIFSGMRRRPKRGPSVEITRTPIEDLPDDLASEVPRIGVLCDCLRD